MAAIPPKQMLEALLKTASLSAKDKEAFEGMWDAVHRYGNLSKRQVAWIEDVYYKLPKLSDKTQGAKVGKFNSPSVKQPRTARDLKTFKALCPEASPETLEKIQAFFKRGGTVINILPVD